jgi:Bacterial Ig-like domain (group 3)
VKQRLMRDRAEFTATNRLFHRVVAWCSAVFVATIAGWWLAAAPSVAAGPAAGITLTLLPPRIPADGVTGTTAIAIVTDALGDPVVGDRVIFSSVSGHYVGKDDNDGTYSTMITSTASPGQETITATDMSVPTVSTTATLTQEAVSTTTLTTTPTNGVTNQPATLIATVVVEPGGVPPSGTITFENGGVPIQGCTGLTLTPPPAMLSAAITCETSFGAAGSPEQLTASFTPTAGANAVGSTGADSLPVGPGATSTSLVISKKTITAGSPEKYTATVTPTDPGPAVPSATVEFLDSKKPVAGCSSQRLTTTTTGSSTATCTITYAEAGRHSITARYGGDGNFTGSTTSKARQVTVHPLAVRGTVKAMMSWTFFFTPTYTVLRALTISGAPVGSTVAVDCSGQGCPFAKRTSDVRKTSCKAKSHKHCPASHPATINLSRGFKDQRLKAGDRITVEITRPQWIGKYYVFTIRRGQPPSIGIDCLAPGASKPGDGC